MDGRAETSFFGYKAAQLVKEHVKPHKVSYTVATGAFDTSCGIVTVDLTVDGLRKEIPLRIANKFDYDCILGMDYLTKFKIVIDHENRQ